MKKFNFKDLPNTDTPIKASTLNTMQSNIEESCVAVSPTQPITGEKVWIQKGKNLLSRIISGYEFTNITSDNISVNDSWFITDFIPVASEEPYYAQGFSTYNKWWFDKDKNFISCTEDNPSIAPSNAEYVRLNGNISNSSNIMVFQGIEATEYEAYIEPKIWCKNDNGVYELLYEETQVINIGNAIIKKYPDGTMECTGKITLEGLNISTQWGNMYETPQLSLGNFPVEFIEAPIVTINNFCGHGFFIESIVGTTPTYIGTTYLARPTIVENINVELSYTATGRWK